MKLHLVCQLAKRLSLVFHRRSVDNIHADDPRVGSADAHAYMGGFLRETTLLFAKEEYGRD